MQISYNRSLATVYYAIKFGSLFFALPFFFFSIWETWLPTFHPVLRMLVALAAYFFFEFLLKRICYGRGATPFWQWQTERIIARAEAKQRGSGAAPAETTE